MANTFKSNKIGWRLPLLLGILVPFVIWGGLRLLRPPVDPNIENAAQVLGYDPRTYDIAVSLGRQAEKQGDLSQRDWQTLMSIFHDPNVKIHQEAIDVMMSMNHSSHRKQILTMVKPLLNDPELGNEVRSLTLLWRFNDPSWRAEALKRKNRPEERMHLAVEDMLYQGDQKQ